MIWLRAGAYMSVDLVILCACFQFQTVYSTCIIATMYCLCIVIQRQYCFQFQTVYTTCIIATMYCLCIVIQRQYCFQFQTVYTTCIIATMYCLCIVICGIYNIFHFVVILWVIGEMSYLSVK